MVRGIFIPASNGLDPEVRDFERLEDYQAAVNGWIEAVDIPTCGSTLFVNEEGLIRGLPANRRATYLWWFHIPEAAGHSRLAGDAVLVGMPDRNGAATDVPRSVEGRLLTPRSYRIRTREPEGGNWRREPIVREDYFETIIWATHLRELSPTAELRIDEM